MQEETSAVEEAGGVENEVLASTTAGGGGLDVTGEDVAAPAEEIEEELEAQNQPPETTGEQRADEPVTELEEKPLAVTGGDELRADETQGPGVVVPTGEDAPGASPTLDVPLDSGSATAGEEAGVADIAEDAQPAEPVASDSTVVAVAASPSAASDAEAAKEDDAALLQRISSTRKEKPRKPGVRWNGRVNGLTLEEYREKKWGTQAGWAMVTRGGPKYSFRTQVREHTRSSPVFCTGDPTAARMRLLRSTPSWSMNLSVSYKEHDKSPGPSEYMLKNTMGPERHPTIRKAYGATFGLPDPPKIMKPSPGPGENHTYLMEKWSKYPNPPRILIQGRNDKIQVEPPGPGVGQYQLGNMTRVGKLAVLGCVTIPEGGKAPGDTPIRERGLSSPAPGEYDVPGTKKCRNHYINQTKPPGWSLAKEPRGLLE
mmetsp:Transcript_56276/g.131859  ORF Transcript_56276/g.131859 Transcript_56276/m.131859 type:complete len:428 (-) Transcript_56276:63-1346(-)